MDPVGVRTLVVLGSSLTALATVRVAGRSGLRCIVVDNARGPAAKSRFARFVHVSAMEMDQISMGLQAADANEGVAIIADSDRWLRFVARNHEALTLRGWLVLHPGPEAIRICLDKSAFLQWCNSESLVAPRPYQLNELTSASETAFPLMVRPEWTQHGMATGLPKAIEIHDLTEMSYWLARFAEANVTPCVCESLLADGVRQYSVGAARNKAGAVHTFLAEKVRPHAEQCAGGTFVTPALQPQVEELAVAALNAIDFFGVAEVEILFNPSTGRASLVEINARPWLQYGLPFACGHDLLAHALGQSPKVRTNKGRGHAWLYFHSDLYTCFSSTSGLVRKGKVRPVEYARTLLAADNFAVWDWRDPTPFVSRLFDTVKRRFSRTARSG